VVTCFLHAGLAAGLSGVTNPNTGQPLKLDIIGFDACLMAMHEIGAVLTPYANYLLASELLEPGIGWDYSALSKYVQGNAWDGAVVNAAGFTAANIADVIIGGYNIPVSGRVSAHALLVVLSACWHAALQGCC
jgi:hypothetical protein